MIYELQETEFEIARPIFSDLEQYQLWLQLVFERIKPGRIFVNDKKNPSAGFCRLGSIFFIFAGSTKDTSFNNELKKTIENDIFPSYNLDYKYFMIFYDPEWFDELHRIFNDLTSGEGVYFTVNRNERKEWDGALPSSFTIERVDKEFIDSKAYTIPQEIRIERWLSGMWGSIENFNKRSFAFAVVHKKQSVVSFCHCSYLSKDKSRAEIGIHTQADFRRKGLGKNLVFHMLNQCWEVGIQTIGWHTTHDNIPSIKLAESVGYKFNRTYPILFGNWP
jgi:RimJ/RimL family protein N-acetyltransferase